MELEHLLLNMETFTLTGTGEVPHASNHGVTLQSCAGDELTLPICKDDEVDFHIADLYLDGEIIALVNFTYDEYIGTDCKYYRDCTGETFFFKLIEGNVKLR